MSSVPSKTLPADRAPGTTSWMRFRQRTSVDLPQPDGPMMAVTALGSIPIETSAIACRVPYQALRSSTRIASASGDVVARSVAGAAVVRVSIIPITGPHPLPTHPSPPDALPTEGQTRQQAEQTNH